VHGHLQIRRRLHWQEWASLALSGRSTSTRASSLTATILSNRFPHALELRAKLLTAMRQRGKRKVRA
jgi:hypothetical protein